MTNPYGIDFDCPGFCAKCHTAVAEFEGSDETGTPKIKRLLGSANQVIFNLNNGTKMPVILCETCELNLKGSHVQEIMESVINGWQKEIDRHWKDETEESKLSKMDDYSKLSITNRNDKPFPSVDLNDIKKPNKSKLNIKVH